MHTEVKLHGNEGLPARPGREETRSQAWFDNVRIYPRPEHHFVGVRLVTPQGKEIWIREDNRWPPKIVDEKGSLRSIEDLEVQLWTGDGEKLVASSRSANMGFYLLPLRSAPWDVYPVEAQIRVVLDGRLLGSSLRIASQGVNGLFPDDVYEVVMAGSDGPSGTGP